MKKYFYAITIFLIAYNLYPQSRFIFANYSTLDGINAPIYNTDGSPLYGANYLAELYGGSTTDNLEEAMTGISGNAYTNVPLRVPFIYSPNGMHGYFRTSNYAIITNVMPGELAYLQVRAWDSNLGQTYEEVMARGLGGYGASSIFTGWDPGFDLSPSPLDGLGSFSLVPEPGSFVLFAFGVIAFALKFIGTRYR